VSKEIGGGTVAARRKGKWTGGPVPLGYDVANRKLLVNEDEAEIVRAVFDLYVERRSTLEVARALDERAYSPKRRAGKAGATGRSASWDAATVGRLLRNPVYAGWIGHKGQRFEGEHEAIIDREMFLRVQRVLDGHNRRGHGRRNDDYLLAGVIRCACCGGAYTTASTRKKGKGYRYYRCVTRDKRGTDACPARPLPAEAIESFVIDRIRDTIERGEFADNFAEPIRVRILKERNRLDRERRALVKRIERFETECETLSATIAGAAAPVQPAIEAQLVEAARELDESRSRELELTRRLDRLADIEVESRWVESALREFPRLWDVMTAANRRRLVQALVERITVDEPAGHIEVRLANLEASLDGADEPIEEETPVSELLSAVG
jgi:hypothetical protein